VDRERASSGRRGGRTIECPWRGSSIERRRPLQWLSERTGDADDRADVQGGRGAFRGAERRTTRVYSGNWSDTVPGAGRNGPSPRDPRRRSSAQERQDRGDVAEHRLRLAEPGGTPLAAVVKRRGL